MGGWYSESPPIKDEALTLDCWFAPQEKFQRELLPAPTSVRSLGSLLVCLT